MFKEYVRLYRRHDNFLERFMEQRIQKLNNPEQAGMEKSLPFPFNLFVHLLLQLLETSQ